LYLLFKFIEPTFAINKISKNSFFFSRASEVREESLRKSLEDLEESLEKKAKEVERVMELKDEEVSALKTDLVSCSLWSRLVANDIKLF